MKCVNTRHKGFKYLAERNNLSVETLEQITHKYWIENKTDEYFPTDIYIQAQLGKIPYQESGENVIKLWERDYKEPKTFKSFEELEEARTEALKFFPEIAVTYHKGYNDDYVLTIRKPLKNLKISAKDLLDKETLNSQERSDFKLVTKDSVDEGVNVEQFAIDINNKKPQMFTFKDGVSVRAPFKPNYQQEDALNAMDDFVKSSKHVFTLSGYAGTGKTSIIEILAQKMKKEHIPVLFCASTNKAAAVLNERVSKSGFTAQTLNKIFGISVEVDSTKKYNANNLVNKLRDVELPYGATVIIDEASMIDEENYGILNEIAARNELKIIYVGDAAQLAPPKDNKLSKVFRDQSHDIKTLTLVERTGDNAILKEATDIRNGKPLSGKSSFNDKGQGVAYIKADNTKRKDNLIKAFVPRLQEDPDYFRILAYSNRQVSAYNTQVRRLLGYNDNVPRVNEPIVGYTNWGYIKGGHNGKSYEFINSEAYKVTEVQQPRNITTNLPEVGKVTLEVIPTVLEDSFGEKRLVNLIDVKGNFANRETALKLAITKSDLWNRANRLPKGSVKSALQDAANAIERFLFVNDDLGEVKGKPYQKKVFDFGYAMTVHKSQGSTFKNVLIDDVDIVNTIKNSEDAKSKQYTPYTDASTPSEIDFSNSEITSTSDVDLGDWANAVEDNTLMTPYPKKDPSMNDKQALLRQQLEYVAVSRASDTATVISNEVVKEDSPLNHLKDAIKAEATENVRSMTSDEVWKAAAEIETPSTERTVEYRDQTYTIRGSHIYNKDGKEVYPKDASNVGKDRNIILAKLAEVDERAVKVNHNNRTYYVDNKKNIISETSGIIMKWGEENGDRKTVLALAEQKFRDMIEPDLISGQIDELMEKAGIPYFNEEDMERYFQEHRKSLIQQAAEENKEMQEIKAKAIADGTFMKAPNGQPTKLNERQWLQVRTKNFINWFGDWINDPANASKVVDENGEPLVVHHGGAKDIRVFKHSSEDNSTTGYGYYTDHITGEKIPIDSNNAIFFSSNEYVGASYSAIYGIKYYRKLRAKIDDILENSDKVKGLNMSLKVFQNGMQDVYELFDNLSEFNPRYKKLKEYIQKLQQEGKRIEKENEVSAVIQLLIEADKKIKEYTNSWLLNNSEWEYQYDRAKTVIEDYNNPEGIKRLIKGEIPETIKKEWEIYKKIEAQREKEGLDKIANYENVHLFLGDGNWSLQYDGKDLILSTPYGGTYHNIKDLSEETLKEYLDTISIVNKNSIERNKNYTSYKAVQDKAQRYAVFLNIKNPLTHDYEGTMQGQGYKQSGKYPFGYVAARQVNKALKEGNDGVIYKNLYDPYLADNYGVFNPNQIKSATDNNGEFSTFNNDIQRFQTPEGEVYGFVDADGNIYIDRRVAKPEHRIHEYTHLWDRMVINREPELWKKGVDLMQQFDNGSLWNEILNSEQYGKKWQESGITGEQLNNLVASEVHARLVGKNGEALLKEVARKRGQKSIINKLKQWMLDVWKSLKATFSNWKPEDVKELTLEDFNQMTLRDFADGLNFGKYTPMLTSKATESTETGLIENTTNQLRDYYRWQRDHVSFDKGSHTYYINGKSVDFSVTEYKDFVYGKPNIKGDYMHSTTIGDVVDELTRDFFTPNSKWEEKEYHNLNDSRKQELVKHLRRFKEYLDKIYKDKEGKPNYKVITSEIPLIGEITVNGEKKTVAGTPDMIVIDGNGDVHIYDMKVKTNNIEDWNNRRDYTFQLNAYRQLIESILPELADKMKDLQLIWFNTKYPKQGKEATFVTSKTGVITVSDDAVKNIPLAEYEKWTTPSLKQDVKESIIPLDKKDVLSEVSPYDTNWKESLEPVKTSSNIENNVNTQQPVQQSFPASYEGEITPDANTIFVFGSNPKGIHGAGAAAIAKSKFGAIQGQGEGLQGNAYAFPTKNLDKAKNTRWYRPGPKEEAEVKEWYKNHSFSEVQNHPLNAERTMTPQQIIEGIQKLYEAARQNPDKQFKVSHYSFGKLSLNGYLGEEMLAMFKQAGEIPSNVVFNKEWTDHWSEIQQTTNPKFTKVNKAFANALINHLKNDKLEGYESPLNREALVKMAEALFDYFKKNDIKIVITNSPYSDAERGKSSVVATSGKFSVIYYQDAALQGGKYLNILHELLHIATNNKIPFDSMGRAIADDKLQLYYDMFINKLTKDKEWKDIQDVAVVRSKEAYGKASDRAKILAHAYSSVGEFLSCAVSNKEVQQVLESITYGETQESNLFEELRKWFKDLLSQIFKGYSYINHSNFLDDITDFLLNSEYSDNQNFDFNTKEEEQVYKDYLKTLEEQYNNAEDFVNSTQVQTNKTQQFVNHSGGATGSDAYWGEVGERYGITSKHYYHGQKTPKGNTEISQQDYEEGKREVAKAAAYNYGYPYSTMKNDLLIRDWSQAKYADAVFAIGHLVKPGEKLFPDVSSDTRVAKNAAVTGGTGYAVTMAILHNKPVYVFDQERNQWYKNINGKWSESEVPTLTTNFAGIGTRNINEAGKKAIEEVYAKTFSNQQQDNTDSLEQNVTPEDEKPMISLPNYASWMGQENFEVEQDWKAERLLELDGQLANTEIPFDVKEKIKKDIEKTLDAVNEEDLYTALSKRDAKKLQEKQGRLAELNRSINRLQNSSILTPSDIHGAAKQIMDNISDMITRIQDEPSIVETWFPSLELQDDVDFTTMTRKEIVETIGIGRFLEAAKKSIDSSEVDYDDVKTEMQADLFVENWNALIQFGNSYFKINEGYGIQLNLTTGEHKTTEGQIIDSDDFNADSDPDRNFENIKDEQEHWQIEQKAIDIMNSSEADLIKTDLHNCYEMDENGQPVLSKWGKGKVHIDKRKAITSILSWVQGELTIKDMYNKLAEKQVKNPWLSGILDKLNPNDPETAYKNSKLQSLFFNVMCRSFQRYSFVQLQDGRYVAKPLNDHPAQTQVIKTIEALFNINEHPLFQYTNGNGNVIKGINVKLLGKAGDSKTDRFTLHSAFEELSDIKDRLEKGETFSAEMSEQAKNNILGVCKILGFVPENPVLNAAISTNNVKYMTDKLKFITQSLDDAYKKEQENLNKPNAAPYEPFKFKGDLSIEGSVRNFFNPITNAMEEIMPNVVYDDGKLYQAYVTPSFLSLLMQKFHWDTDKFNDFIEKQYGYSEWFKTKDGYWRNDMLRRMATDEKARKAFSHTVELNLNNHRYMKNLSDIEYAVSLFAHYWGENTRKGDTNPIAWFRMPMQSNKPSSEFFSFYSYRGANYKKNIVDGGLSREEMLSGAGGGLYGTFLQEMERIKTVLMRNKEEGDPDYIQNFDKFGRYFNFLVFLNPYLASGKAEERNLLEETTEYKEKNGITKNENLAKLIQKRLEGEKTMSGEELLEMGNLAREAIRNALEKKAQKILDNWEETGILDAAKKVSYIANEIKDIKDEDAKNAAVRELLENFIWNDHFAAINILQLTIGDIAFYKNAEDLQKRLSQLHAPGIRPNVFAVVDNKDTRASDGKYRTLLIKDYDPFITNIIQNLEEVFDRRIANAKTAEEKKGWEMLKEDLVGSNGKYRKINVTDAQGYNSPTSYRKKAIMFGRWSSEAEEIYQKLARGDKNLDNVRTAFQPLKPFVYTQLHKDIGVKSKSEDGTSIESPIQHMPVPLQAKNSEYLLIMADALLKGEELSRPNLLRAIFRVMEDSAYDNREYDEYGRITKMGDYNGRGIDTIQFESAIKSGKQGVIDLNQFVEQPEGEESAYTFMMNQIYQRNDKGELTREYNTKTFIHETDFESYCLQQDVPGHFRNHYQAQGSQERMIIPSDLEYYKNPTLTVEEGLDNEDNINYYGKYKADEIRKEIENVTAANINLSIKEFKERLKWDSASEAEKNMALSEILQEEILDSTRYGIDMFLACGLDENGEFRIPLGDPIQAKRIEQLLNSIIKNSINKQEIAGGPIVQVSNYGVSRQLQIKFHDKNGGILLTKEEFEAKKNIKAYEKYKNYDDYKHENQAGIAYFEVFAPAWMRSLFKYFTDAYGNIDLETLEILNPDLLKMISYRIPTEDKYSIAPMKLVGFMPKEAGDALMLPYEITEIDDSDFDIDKRYVMRKVINIEPMFEVAKDETFGKALDRYIKENKSNLIDNIIRNTNIKETLSKEEKQEITEGIGKSIELEKRTAERTHQENLAVIETRYEQLDDANAATTWDKDAEKDDRIYEQNSARQDKSHQREIDRENKRYEAQLKKIEERRKEKEEREQAKAIGRKIRQQVSDFLYLKSGKFYSPAGADDANTRAIRTAFLKQIFKLNDASDQRTVNNNKIIDLTWDVLTNEKTASMILNPGGYDNFKKNCYMILNFQDLAKDIHDPEKLVELWNELKGKKIDELKSAIKTNNDLTWVDTQLQFYRQNSAAASLLGRFAIEKIAHAILEGNGIFVNVKEICGIESFSIAGFTFGGKRSKTGKALLSAEDFSEDKKLSNEMTYEEYLLKNDYDPTLDNMTELDPTYSSNGFFVGKSLGSGVSASADAGKEDALSPVNINKNTINAFTSSLRFGMPHDISELFMAQKIIKEVLTEYVRSSIEDHKSLDEIIDNKLNAFEKEYGESSMLKNGKLSEAELLEGMLDREHKEVDYKVLYIFDKLKKLAEEVKKPTFITRFNSISNAVGPLIVDNLVMRHKMDDMDVSNINDIHFYKRAEDGTMAKVTMDTIFEDHPILKAFAETVGIAETLFRRMPAGSSGFKTLLDQMPSILSEKISQRIWNDKGLLNDLSNFYQSYLIIQAGLIKDTELKEFIEDFPKTFEKGYKKKYGNNAFVNAVMMSTSEKTSRTFLNIPQTGFDETVKDVYRSDMIELYKENPKLVWDLFKYAFFRGGINFSPKTWMNLVSTFIKERLETVNQDGKKVSYKDVYNYKTFPTVNPKTLLDQFVRNNWNDTKLVPRKKLEDTKYEIGSNNALLTVTDASEVAELSGIAYLKTVDEKKNAYLWRLLGKEEDNKEHRLYGRISPLGDNGEYLEMFRDTSTTKNDMDVLRRKPMTETTKESDKAASEGDLENSTLIEGETDGRAPRRELTDSEKIKNIEDFGEGILMQWQGTVNRNKTRADALKKADEIIGEVKNTGKLQKGMKAFISLALAKKGVVVSEDKVIEKLRELNLCD